MPTKRRFFIFLIVLAVMLLVKYAAGQETVSWETVSVWDGDSTRDIYAVMELSLIFGMLAGTFRACLRNLAARSGNYFTGDLITLRISAQERTTPSR